MKPRHDGVVPWAWMAGGVMLTLLLVFMLTPAPAKLVENTNVKEAICLN